MENILLLIHLIIAVCLIAVVLMQRSEGGALGIGGGGGGLASARSSGNPLSKLTWYLATAFLATSITLAILAGGNPAGRSVIDGVGAESAPLPGGLVLPDLPDEGGGVVVPPSADDGPALTLPPSEGAAGGAPSEPAGTPVPVAPPSAD
ncbi:MAG: preprotein translocase subunit SecG [Paracoccaceae bacterium]